MLGAALLCALVFSSAVRADICELTFCTCEEVDVSCTGTTKEDVILSPGSLPPSVASISLTALSSLTLETGSFSEQQELKELSIENVKKVLVKKLAYSKEEVHAHVSIFKVENVEDFDIEQSGFVNFPQSTQVEFKNVKFQTIPVEGLKLYSDTMLIDSCEIGKLERESIYSDSQVFSFTNNKVKLIKEKAFSGSNNKFNMTNNDIGMLETNAISVAFLAGDISRNTIHKYTGTPLRDIGPDPICMPDPEAYSYDDADSPVTIEYNVVGSPSLVFEENFFHKFNMKLLDFSGTHNVPLGSLTIARNKVWCECEDIRELAILADFDHLLDESEMHYQASLGDLILKKEFYSSSVCQKEDGTSMSLKKFSRQWLAVKGEGESLEITCQQLENNSDWMP